MSAVSVYPRNVLTGFSRGDFFGFHRLHHGCQFLGSRGLSTRQQVCVDIGRCLAFLVAGPLLNHLQICFTGKQHERHRVPQFVEADH